MSYLITKNAPFGLIITKKSLVADSYIDIQQLKELIQDQHLIVLRDFYHFTTTADFIKFCEAWGTISLWPFGKVLDLVQKPHPQDHIFSNSAIPFHWDGMYRPQIPALQIFNCLAAPPASAGGKTFFSNTRTVLSAVPKKIKHFWQQIKIAYQREMEFYQSTTLSPLIVQHPFADYDVIRYSAPHETGTDFINPSKFTYYGIDAAKNSDLHQSLAQALYAKDHYYAHQWQAGDIVIADNFTLLHGREAFTTNAPRHIQRVHIESNPAYSNSALVAYQ